MRVPTCLLAVAVSSILATGCGGGDDTAPDSGQVGTDGGATDDGGSHPDAGNDSDAGVRCENPDEPNDTDAQAVELFSAATGCLAGADTDVFRIPPSTEAGLRTIVIQADTGEYGVEVSAVSGASPGFLADTAVDQQRLELWWASEPGITYWLRVKGLGGDIPYEITSSWIEVVDPLEPDDTMEEATDLEPGTPIHGWLFAGYIDNEEPGPRALDDWFAVELTQGPFEAIVRGGPALECAIDFEFWLDGTRADVFLEHGSAPDGDIVGGDLDQAGRYLIRMSSSWQPLEFAGFGSSRPCWTDGEYELTVTQ